MLKKIQKTRKKNVGLSPGSLVHIGEQKEEITKLTLCTFDSDNLTVKEIDHADFIRETKADHGIAWLNVCGLHDISLFEEIKNMFQIDPLLMEDILNTSHLPKIEIQDEYIFIIAKIITFNCEEKEAEYEHCSLLLGKNFLLSFQEKEGNIFDPVRQRLKNANGRLRKQSSDYLFYALLDVIVDNYYLVLQQVGDCIESLDEAVINHADKKIVFDIQNMKRNIMLLRRSVWPLRQAIHDLKNEDAMLISKFVRPYLGDLYDHTYQITETIEIFRDLANGTMDVYLSMLSNRMNDVMRMLTIIATIFIPLTFIAGVYGMNFESMPELSWRFGYTLIWGIMLTVALVLILYFKKKRWL
jgi:magnesium transporter